MRAGRCSRRRIRRFEQGRTTNGDFIEENARHGSQWASKDGQFSRDKTKKIKPRAQTGVFVPGKPEGGRFTSEPQVAPGNHGIDEGGVGEYLRAPND
jgi:hypothetical protein